MTLAERHIIHNRPYHLFTRVHAFLVVVVFAAFTGALLRQFTTVHLLTALAMLAAVVFLAYFVTGRFWTVTVSSGQVILRRLWSTRRVPLAALVDVYVPLLARLNRPFWPERRLRFEDGSSVAFFGSQQGLARLEELRRGGRPTPT